MSKKEKALAKLRQNPRNVRFEEIETILSKLGFTKRQDGTSHAVFTYGKHRLTVPHRRPFVLPCYVKQILDELDKMELEDTETDQELEEPNID